MKQWSRAMNEQGITPLFPPREDVRVGDIYLYDFDPEGKEAQRRLKAGDLTLVNRPRWGSLDLQAVVSKQYQSRRPWPDTLDDFFKGGPEDGEEARDVGSVPADPDSRDIHRGGGESDGATRLRLASFPDFLTVSFTSGDIGALVPIEGFNVGLAGSAERDYKGVVKIPSAESYAVDARMVLAAMLEQKPGENGTYLKKTVLSTFLIGSSDTPPGDERLYLRVVTEVYYARALDVGIRSTNGLGFQAVVSTPSVPDQGAAPATQPTPERPGERLGEEEPNATEITRPLEEAMSRSGSRTVPGGSVQLLAANGYGIAMRRHFKHPVAIGVRGLVLEIDGNGKVYGIRYINSPLPFSDQVM